MIVAGNYFICGFGDSLFSVFSYVGATSSCAGVYGSTIFATGSISKTGTAASMNAGTTAMLALDLDAGKGWIYYAGAWQNSGNPAAGSNPTWTWTPNTSLTPAASVYSAPDSVTLNAGSSAFVNSVPSGFSGWQ
jgi:hypothetical protein